ncbi:hypothetical protein IVA80_14250 [Bradyrhizobium sp. 139]|uniref:hypothetical protein n=1 Tax=Bradyrhizobium sp. 139 TaxID=2782616 RepID=UPI001FF9B3DE|nr:hypothetical protein [Bradyrhizobium sp. 139]MCK1742004.1 hypothetical protein [Bradyrhizobium sp. 139]
MGIGAEKALVRVRLPLLEAYVRNTHDGRGEGDKECHCRFFSLIYIRRGEGLSPPEAVAEADRSLL